MLLTPYCRKTDYMTISYIHTFRMLNVGDYDVHLTSIFYENINFPQINLFRRAVIINGFINFRQINMFRRVAIINKFINCYLYD
jgi:hypothetical protein